MNFEASICYLYVPTNFWKNHSCCTSQAIPPIPTHFSRPQSVCLSSLFCIKMLKPFHVLRCNAADLYTCVVLRHIVLERSWPPKRRKDFGVEPPAKACNCKSQPNHQTICSHTVIMRSASTFRSTQPSTLCGMVKLVLAVVTAFAREETPSSA